MRPQMPELLVTRSAGLRNRSLPCGVLYYSAPHQRMRTRNSPKYSRPQTGFFSALVASASVVRVFGRDSFPKPSLVLVS